MQIFLPFALVQLGNAMVSMRRLNQFLVMEERTDNVSLPPPSLRPLPPARLHDRDCTMNCWHPSGQLSLSVGFYSCDSWLCISYVAEQWMCLSFCTG